MLSSLEKSILATIAYFDIFNYPLTSLEVYKYLLSPRGEKLDSSYSKTKQLLETSPSLRKKIETQNGFYFLNGRSNIINIRKERYVIAEKKFLHAKKYIKILSKLPFVEMIGICNTLAYYNSREESDIDLTIICKPGKIWLVRILAVTLIEFLRKRPTQNNLKDKICLSFYLTQDNLNLQDYQYECPDIYLLYWQSQFLPIYINKKINLVKQNRWIKQYLPNIVNQELNQRRLLDCAGKSKSWCEKIFFCQAITNYLSRLAKNYQLKVLPTSLKVAAKEPNTNVVLNDKIIKLHGNDRRQEYNQKWRLKYKSILKFYENPEQNH